MIISLVGKDPAVMSAAWQHLNQRIQAVPALEEGEILPPIKRLKPAV
jgi:hypothetical protein